MRKILLAPYPFPNLKENFKSAFIASICITLFLLLFQPFGLNTIENIAFRTGIIVGYGLITFAAVSFISIMLFAGFKNNLVNEIQWNVRNHIVLMITNLLLVSIGNFIYSHLIFNFKLSFENLFRFSFYTFSVGIFPIIFLVLIQQYRQLKKYSAFAESFLEIKSIKQVAKQENNSLISVKDYKNETVLQIEPLQFVLAESSENYCEIYYSNHHVVKKLTIRCTLTKTSEQLSSFRFIFKCHRSYLVNLNHIEKIEANAQGLKLKIKKSEITIPVSRNLHKEFKEKWQEFISTQQ